MEDINKSEEYFRKAIAADPQYAKAHAGLAEVLIYPAAWGYASIKDALPPARTAALEAIQLDADIAETQQLIGTIYEFAQEFDKAEIACLKAIKLDPTHGLSYLRMARIKSAQKRYSEAIEYAEKFAKLEPFSAIAVGMVPNMLTRAGKYAMSVEKTLRLLEEFPNDNNLLWQLGLTYACQGKYKEAIATLKRRSAATADYNFVVGYSHGMNGDAAAAQDVLDFLLKKNENSYVPPAMIAAVYYGIGEMTLTREWLIRESNYSFLLLPLYDKLRDQPEFREIFDMSGK